MGKVILLINHWALPYALHSNVCREASEHLPHVVQCYLRSDSAKEHFHAAQGMFRIANARGFRTVCLGVTEWTESPDGMVDCTRRFEAPHQVDHASTWCTFPWRSTGHDTQVIDEAYRILENSAHQDLFLCLNLLSCRDISNAKPSAGNSLDPRLIPRTVSTPELFSAACHMAMQDLSSLFADLHRLLVLAQDRGAAVGMSVLSSLSMGEHGMFGSSHMKEGTTGFFVSSEACGGSAYVDEALLSFVRMALTEGDAGPPEEGSFPYLSVVGGVERRVVSANDRLYSCVQGKVFDLTQDSDETVDIRLSLSHLQMVEMPLDSPPPHTRHTLLATGAQTDSRTVAAPPPTHRAPHTPPSTVTATTPRPQPHANPAPPPAPPPPPPWDTLPAIAPPTLPMPTTALPGAAPRPAVRKREKELFQRHR